MAKFNKTEHVAVLVQSASQNRIKIGRVTNLDGKIIKGVRMITPNESTNDPLGRATVSATVFKKAFLSLETMNGKEEISLLPLTALAQEYNNGDVPEFTDKLINFENSYITIGETTGLTAGTVFQMLVAYEDKK